MTKIRVTYQYRDEAPRFLHSIETEESFADFVAARVRLSVRERYRFVFEDGCYRESANEDWFLTLIYTEL